MSLPLQIASQPVLSCQEAGEFEARLFQGDEAREWPAMQRAGDLLAAAVGRDILEIGGLGAEPRFLVLVGKGHNGGDALIAARGLLAGHPRAHADIVFPFGERTLRPLTRRAWAMYQADGFNRISVLVSPFPFSRRYDVCVDGVFGFQFRPPLPAGVAGILKRVNSLDIRLRAAVDLPSGWDEPDAFSADFTYATGIAKEPLLTVPNAGRLRLLDLGWDVPPPPRPTIQALSAATLAPLSRLRGTRSDKRSFGHLGVIGGSRQYPGAILMTVRAALQSGCGLLTAFVPESLVASFAAAAPEAMWVGWPETPEGYLSMDGAHELRRRRDHLTAMVIGPGLGRGKETMACLAAELPALRMPVVIDADALQPELVEAGTCPRILTPHAGEFARIAGGRDLATYAATQPAVVVFKGPVTRIAAGSQQYCSFLGGPVLARGGSGDILAGIIGSLLAQAPQDPLGAAATGVVWQGAAADALARAQGATAVTTTDILPFLATALRGSGC